MGANQLYKLMCCGKVTRTPKGNWDVCYSCGTKEPRIEEVDKEDDVLFVGGDKNIPTPSPSVGDTLLMGTKGSTAIKKTKPIGDDKMGLPDYKRIAIDSLRSKAVADKENALLSLSILLDHPAGIGDHSTGDLYNNLNEALSALADADDRLDTLDKYL
jgi:hypothetical protein